MVVHISGSLTTTYWDFPTEGETYVLDPLARITVIDNYCAFIGDTGDVTFRIEGAILHAGEYYVAIEDQGTGTRIEIAEIGMVRGHTCLSMAGDTTDIVNNGSIEARYLGINVTSAGAGRIVNTGLITAVGSDAIHVHELTPSFTIKNDGIISGGIFLTSSEGTIALGKNSVVQGSLPIYDLSPEDSMTRVDNAGRIRSGASVAYLGEDGADHFTNSGRILGNVDLGDGEDRFVMRGGRMDGTVLGGGGDDTFFLRKGRAEIVELVGQGDDRLKSAVSYVLDAASEIETIKLAGKNDIAFTGSGTDNVILGNAGDNRLDGGAGIDTLSGKGGADIFVFSPSCGADTITDFEPGRDRIRFSGFADVDGFADLPLKRSGGDVVIDLGAGDTVTIENITVRALDKGDFLFSA